MTAYMKKKIDKLQRILYARRCDMKTKNFWGLFVWSVVMLVLFTAHMFVFHARYANAASLSKINISGAALSGITDIAISDNYVLAIGNEKQRDGGGYNICWGYNTIEDDWLYLMTIPGSATKAVITNREVFCVVNKVGRIFLFVPHKEEWVFYCSGSDIAFSDFGGETKVDGARIYKKKTSPYFSWFRYWSRLSGSGVNVEYDRQWDLWTVNSAGDFYRWLSRRWVLWGSAPPVSPYSAHKDQKVDFAFSEHKIYVVRDRLVYSKGFGIGSQWVWHDGLGQVRDVEIFNEKVYVVTGDGKLSRLIK